RPGEDAAERIVTCRDRERFCAERYIAAARKGPDAAARRSRRNIESGAVIDRDAARSGDRAAAAERQRARIDVRTAGERRSTGERQGPESRLDDVACAYEANELSGVDGVDQI